MDKETFEQTLARMDKELKSRKEEAAKRKTAEQDLAQVRKQMEAVSERLRLAEEISAGDLVEQLTGLLRGLTEEEERILALLKKPLPAPTRVTAPAKAPAPPVPPAEKAPSKRHKPAPPVDTRFEEAPRPPKREPAPAPAPEPAPEPARPPTPAKPVEEDMDAVRQSRLAAEALVEEVEERLPTMYDEPVELRNARFQCWSIRWRLLKIRAERDLPSANAILTWAFARLMEARKSVPEVPFLTAFNPKEQADWPKELADAEGLLARLRLKHRPPRTRAVEVYARRRVEETKAEQRTQDAMVALDALKAVPVEFSLPEDPDGVNAFREAARACVKFARKIGPELRDACGPYRDLLEGDEYQPIWEVEEKPEATPQETQRASEEASERRRTWSRRDMLLRMLRRMYVKKEIGGKHTEIHNLYQGLPDHMRGVAKAGVDLLIKEGVLRWKPTTKDEHVSIEPPAVRVVEDLMEGKTLPPNIQRWMDATP